jgi:hypothetical protein
MADDPKPTLRLVSNRAKAWEYESLDRWGPAGPRYRQRALAPWQPKRKKPKRKDR